MSTSSQLCLGGLRLFAQQRADMQNNPFVSTPEWNSYVNYSYKNLYDKLVACYGNDYFVAAPYQFNLSGGTQQYALPDGSPSYIDVNGNTAAKFYKLLGVDAQYSTSPNGWVTVQRFEFIERNKWGYQTSAAWNWQNGKGLLYRIEGDKLFFPPGQQTGQLMQIWYVPAPTNLQFVLSTGLTMGSTTATILDTTGLAVGMNVSGTGIQDNTVISSIASTSVVLSQNALATSVSATLSYWTDSTLLEGIAGWEEVVIIEAAIKALTKQESDYTGLADQYNELMKRIEGMGESRDIGQAQHVTDVQSIAGWNDGYGGYSGWGYGSGGGWGF